MAKTTVVGLFDNYKDAQSAVNDLEAAGFGHNDVSLVSNNADSSFGTHESAGSTGGLNAGGAARGLVGGAAEGAVLGGLTGLAASLALLLIPGIGPVAAIGPLAATLSGAGLGAAGGGIIGGLTGFGIPKHEAGVYSEGVRRGGTLVTVRTDESRADEAAGILDRYNPVDIDQRGSYYRSTGYSDYSDMAPHYTPEQIASDRAAYTSYATNYAATAPVTDYAATTTPATDYTATAPVTSYAATTTTPASTTIPTDTSRTVQAGETVTVPIVEEQLVVGKREVERGAARIRTFVTETPVNEQVTLREEHVTVDRRPVDRAVTDADMAFREGTIEVRERAEEAVVSKNARVVEEVVIGKEATQRTETISDTVRRTDVDVDQDMDSSVTTSNTGYATTGVAGAGTTGFTPTGVANSVPGIQTGGRDADGSPDSRGITEKIADTVTGDRIDDKTGKRV